MTRGGSGEGRSAVTFGFEGYFGVGGVVRREGTADKPENRIGIGGDMREGEAGRRIPVDAGEVSRQAGGAAAEEEEEHMVGKEDAAVDLDRGSFGADCNRS